jgi:hypothetical protein
MRPGSRAADQRFLHAAIVGKSAPPHGEGTSGGVLPTRVTTTAADSKRDARAAGPNKTVGK